MNRETAKLAGYLYKLDVGDHISIGRLRQRALTLAAHCDKADLTQLSPRAQNVLREKYVALKNRYMSILKKMLPNLTTAYASPFIRKLTPTYQSPLMIEEVSKALVEVKRAIDTLPAVELDSVAASAAAAPASHAHPRAAAPAPVLSGVSASASGTDRAKRYRDDDVRTVPGPALIGPPAAQGIASAGARGLGLLVRAAAVVEESATKRPRPA